MLFHNWGSTPEEVNSPVIGDELCTTARVIATRSITLSAPPTEVFPWIQQMGFGRAGWYSYDIIDNLGRKSATKILPQWQNIQSGDAIPGGPISFEAAIVDAPHSFVLRVETKKIPRQRMCFTLAYELRPEGTGTRLVTRMRARLNIPGGFLFERLFLGPGDGIMLRKQLLTMHKNIH